VYTCYLPVLVVSLWQTRKVNVKRCHHRQHGSAACKGNCYSQWKTPFLAPHSLETPYLISIWVVWRELWVMNLFGWQVICCWWSSGVEHAASLAVFSGELYALYTSVYRTHIYLLEGVVLFSGTVCKFSYLYICICAEVTVKQLKERIKELDEKLESSAQVLSSWCLWY